MSLRAIAGWDAAALVLAALEWWIIGRSPSGQTRAHAAADDPGRAAASILVLGASTVSLFTTAVVLRQARTCPPDARLTFVALCMLAVATAWVLTHTIFTLRYAHLFYRDGVEREGGLAFPGGNHPSYIDFAYFAFTVGMCFQVSDVAVTSTPIRRTVLGHAVLAFAYNTVILAVALNLAIGVFG